MKAVCQGTKKEGKIFTICNVNPSMISSCSDFIRQQLNEEITPSDLEIGCITGKSVIRVRNGDNLSELWSDLGKPGSKVTVWCDGLKEKGTASQSMHIVRIQRVKGVASRRNRLKMRPRLRRLLMT